VKFIDREGGRTEWSQNYTINYKGGSGRYLERYFKPKLNLAKNNELVETAELMTNLLLSRSQTPDLFKVDTTNLSNAIKDPYYDLVKKLGDQASTYLHSEQSNLSPGLTYSAYAEFVLEALKLRIHQDTSKSDEHNREKLISALTRLKTEVE